MDKVRSKPSEIKDRLIRKKIINRKTPSTPYNTTQYIIDANHTYTETLNIYGEDHDQIQYSFNHHPMGGSMMSMMSFMQGGSFAQLLGAYNEASSNSEEHCVESVQEGELQDNRLVNSIGSQEDTDIGTGDNYSQYLKQSETGENLGELVRNLVEILRQKDQQIEEMKVMIAQ